ncbi:MAG: glutamate racemase, partial [Candidatus Hydrothermia bacterium]
MKDKPIGFFDSGLGGLTVVREFVKLAPSEDIMYLGDTARLPYGTKSAEAVIRFSLENLEFLLGKDVKMVVVACSTSASVAMEIIREKSPVPAVGVVEAGANAVVFTQRTFRKIGVIGTTASINKGEYQRLIKEKQSGAQIVARACPLFVPLVEEGMVTGPIPRAIVEYYLHDMRDTDALVLGCTHYPLLKPLLSEYMGSKTTLVDPSEEAARVLKKSLDEKDMNRTRGQGRVRVFLTDFPPGYETLVSRFLGPVPLNI